MKPRLLFISNLFPDASEPYRGLDNATILHHLRGEFDIRVVAPRPVPPHRLLLNPGRWLPRAIDEAFQPIFVPTPYLPKIGGLANHHLMARALRHALARLWDQHPWDIQLASWLFPDGCASAKLARPRGVPSVLIAQGSDVHRYLHSPLRRKAILRAAHASAAIITRSRSLAMLLTKAGVESGKLHPIHNGTDTATFHPADPAQVREELGLPSSARVLLFVGNLLPVKNPHFLLEQFARLHASGQWGDLRLIMIGKGPLRESLETTTVRLGIHSAVTFTGPLQAPEVARWMQAADLFVMTSRNEGLPNVILEAQACGLPIASTDVGDIAELVPSPAFGKLATEGDAEAWLTAAASLLAQPPDHHHISAIGQGRTWANTAERYHALLNVSVIRNALGCVLADATRRGRLPG